MATKANKPLSKPVDYVEKVKRLDWAELAILWEKIKNRKTTGWSKGKAFEHLILRAFELSGAEVTWPYSVEVQGQVVEQIDGMISHERIACLVEAKDYDANLNVEPLVKLRNQLLRRPSGLVGCVFSSTGFTEPAKTLAQFMAPQALLLWQQPEIEYLLIRKRDFSTALNRKYYLLMQMGYPDYDTRADDIR